MIRTGIIIINIFGNTNDSHTETIGVVHLKSNTQVSTVLFSLRPLSPVISSPSKKQEINFVKNNYQNLLNPELSTL